MENVTEAKEDGKARDKDEERMCKSKYTQVVIIIPWYSGRDLRIDLLFLLFNPTTAVFRNIYVHISIYRNTNTPLANIFTTHNAYAPSIRRHYARQHPHPLPPEH